MSLKAIEGDVNGWGTRTDYGTTVNSQSTKLLEQVFLFYLELGFS